jgi:hypothetical protein
MPIGFVRAWTAVLRPACYGRRSSSTTSFHSGKQAADASAVTDGVVCQDRCDRLPGRDDPMMAICQLGNQSVDRPIRLSFPGIISGLLRGHSVKRLACESLTREGRFEM